MKKILTLSAFIIPLMFTAHSFAGKIVDIERVGDHYTITYAPANKRFIECTAYNNSGDAIGGGEGFPSESVARVSMVVPLCGNYHNKYAGSNLRFACKEKDHLD